MNNQWKGTNRHKYLLQFPLIFVCKYRKHLLARKDLSDRTKELSRELCLFCRKCIRADAKGSISRTRAKSPWLAVLTHQLNLMGLRQHYFNVSAPKKKSTKF